MYLKTRGHTDTKVMLQVHLKAIKVQTQDVMDRGRPWMEELEDAAKRVSKKFQEDDVELSTAMVLVTRAKIHRHAHNVMHRLRREMASTGDCNRLSRLICIHKEQMRKYDPEASARSNAFYDEMLTVLLHKIEFQKLLKLKLSSCQKSLH